MAFSKYSRLTFAPTFKILSLKDMDNIKNTRGKGYCMLYLLMFFFLFTCLVLMLCNRGSLLEFPK